MDFNNDEQEDTRTIFCGNLNQKITEELLYELFLQAGPLEKVRIPNDREGRPHTYGFITYRHQSSVPYAISLFENLTIFNNRLNLRPRKMESFMAKPGMFTQIAPQMNMNANDNMAPSYNDTSGGQQDYYRNESSRGRQDYYRSESLQGRYLPHNKRERDMRPNENNGRNHKRRKR